MGTSTNREMTSLEKSFQQVKDKLEELLTQFLLHRSKTTPNQQGQESRKSNEGLSIL